VRREGQRAGAAPRVPRRYATATGVRSRRVTVR
jgi:hypothetical protein